MLPSRMVNFLQVLCLVALVFGAVLWFSWVQETMRTVRVPERLGEIVVYGVEEKNALDLAKVISVGFVGSVAEHKRVVAFINSASRTRSGDEISALNRISSPAPSLLKTSTELDPGKVDIKLEIAGAKLETQGLQRFLYPTGPRKGSISISVILNSSDRTNFAGVASASFPEDSDYGFSLNVTGSADSVAQQIALRYIQAHYAKEDQFYSALSADDFRKFWEGRTKAATIVLKRAGSAIDDEPARVEARDVLKSIDHLVRRYRNRGEIQKLAAYLSSVAHDYVSAKEQLEYAANVATNGDEGPRLKKLIKKIEQDINKRGTSVRADSALEPLEATIMKQAAIADTGLAAAAQKAQAAGRQVRVTVLLGPTDSFPQFGDRVGALSRVGRTDADQLREHTNGVAGLIAALAPTSRVQVISVFDKDSGAADTDVIAGIERALSENSQILVVPLGPLKASVMYEHVFRKTVELGTFVLAAAGNEGVDARLSGAAIAGVVYVGSSEGNKRASYSNYGSDVAIYAPGSVLTYSNPTTLVEGSGTAIAIVAAAVANLIAASTHDHPTPGDIEHLLLAKAKPMEGGRLLYVGD